MAISNFASLSAASWRNMSQNYTQINPVVSRTGENDSSISVTFYVSNADNTAFVLSIQSSAAESLNLTVDPNTPDDFDLVCQNASSGQGVLYFSFNESEGWTANFDLSVSLTTTSSKKGTWTFTKGKGEENKKHLPGRH